MSEHPRATVIIPCRYVHGDYVYCKEEGKPGGYGYVEIAYTFVLEGNGYVPVYYVETMDGARRSFKEDELESLEDHIKDIKQKLRAKAISSRSEYTPYFIEGYQEML